MTTFFGPYEVVAEVASGSTGTVFRVRHTELDREAAVKELSPELRDVPGFVERMRAEGETLASLDNEHIVKVYDFVEEPDKVWIAEQWIDGLSLEKLLVSQGPLTAEQSVGVIRGALIGLAYAHDRDLVHRDIAPNNILADQDGTSMLVDFGLAAPVGGISALGTPAYLSPEAARGEPVTKPSDVYSAAAVLFALLNGTPPFLGADPAAVVKQHAESVAPALTGHGPEFQAVIARSLDKNPANRPPDAAALLTELEDAAETRFGAGWLARASIAGLVAAATGVGVATTSGTAVTAGVGAAETATVDTATLSTSTAVPRKILGMSAKQAVAAAITTVVVIVGATIGANAYSNHQDKVKAEKAAAKKVAIEKAKVKAFAANAPSGKWNVVSTITSSDFDGDKIGQISTFTWTFDSTCEKYLCTGTISSSSGNKFPYTWDGKTIVREVVAPKPEARTCIDTATGIETKGTSAVVTVVYESAPLVAEPAGTPTKLVGDFTETNSYSQYVDCNASEPRKRVERFVATKS